MPKDEIGGGQTIPASAFVQMAVDRIKAKDTGGVVLLVLDAELKEFRELGTEWIDAFRKSLPPGLTTLELGYLLGMETARVLVEGMPAAIAHGITI